MMLVALSTQAYAAHDDDKIDISLLGGDVAPGVWTNWSFDQATNTITVTDNVTIFYIIDGAINGKTLIIDNTANKTVTWETQYRGTLNKVGPDNKYLVLMTGSGVLNIIDYAVIYQYGDSGAVLAGNSTVNVSGNSIVSSEATDAAPHAHTIVGEVVTVSDNAQVICESDGSAIWFTKSITISGNALVSSSSGTTIYCGFAGPNPTSTVTVEGGTVESGSGTAIYANSSSVIVNGGVVRTTSSYAIFAGSDSGTVTINGGEVISTSGTSIRASALLSLKLLLSA